jgi:hypothetical protein
MRIRTIAVVGIGIALLAASCAVEPERSGAPSDPTPGEATTTTVGTDESGPPSTDEIPVDEAIADLAEELEVAPDAIRVVSSETVVWNDGSLGCPQPGMAYTQALVSGYRIVLEAEGDTYAYHGADGSEPFLCDERLAEGEPRPRP